MRNVFLKASLLPQLFEESNKIKGFSLGICVILSKLSLSSLMHM